MAEPNVAVEPEVHVPGYHIHRTIASGGMGQVRRAHDTAFDREVAVKVLLPECRRYPELVARFATEARITGRLQHPGIPPVHHIGQLPDGSPFLAMKLIQGRTLAELLVEKSRERPELIRIFEQICQAVGYAHQCGVIHRDLKPQNVMVGEFGEVQVMDWGVAKEMRNSGCGVRNEEQKPVASEPSSLNSEFRIPNSELIVTPLSEPPLDRTAVPTPAAETTQPGQVFGTILYMPPEQALGHVDRIDARSDVFSLGAILCELLTGKPPYHGFGRAALEVKAQNGDTADAFRRLDECGADPELLALCKHCLAKERDDRPADGGTVAKLVAHHRANVEKRLRDAEAEQAATAARLAGERKRRRLRQLSAALAGVLVLGGIAVAWWDDHRARRRELEIQAEEARLQQSELQRVQAESAQLQKTQQARIGFAANLKQGLDHVHQCRFAAARNSLDAATGLLAGGGLDDLHPVASQARADLDFAFRLDDIRFKKWVWISQPGEQGTYDRDSAAPEYRKAFAEQGLDIDAHDPATLAARIGESNIRDELVDALDDWAVYEPDAARKARIFAVLKRVDPDPWRDRFRDPVVRRNREGLRQLAGEVDLARQRPAVVTALAEEMDFNRLDSFDLLRGARLASPTDFQLLFAMGMWYHERDPERAIGFYRAARAVRPDNAAVNMNLGTVLGKSGRAEDRAEAIACFQLVIVLAPQAASPHYNLGILFVELNENATARTHFEAAIQRDPRHASAHHNLGVVLGRLGDNAGAEREYREAIRLAPRKAMTHSMLADLLWKRGDKEAALREYRLAADLDPTDPDYPFNLGHAFHKDGRLDEAIIEYKKAIAIDPKHGKAHNNLGIAYRDTGNRTAAIATFRKVIAIDPKNATAHYNLGVMLQDENPPSEAIACFRTAIALEPGYARAHAHLGGCLYNAGKINEGLAELRLATRLADNDPEPHFMLALPLLISCEFGEAQYHLREAARLDPRDLKIRKAFAWGLRMSRDWVGAVEQNRAILAIDPDDAESHYALGVALLNLGRFPEALPSLTRGHQLGSKTKGWSNPSAAKIQRCKDLIRIDASIEKLLSGELEPDDAEEYILAAEACRLAHARFADAVTLYRKAFQADPSLATRFGAEHRMNAVRAAVQAAAAKECKPADRTRFRKSALAWIKAELAAADTTLEKKPSFRLGIRQMVAVLLYDPTLATVRNPFFLANLPPVEGEAWLAFWEHVRQSWQDSYPIPENDPM